MSPLELLNEYLGRLEKRFRLAAVVRGSAIMAAVALAVTLVATLAANWFAFSPRSLTAGRFALFFALSFTFGFALFWPLLVLDRRKAARAAERKAPGFDQRLVTLAERAQGDKPEPFLELLAADTLDMTLAAQPEHMVGRPLLAGMFGAAAASLGVLAWLVLGASGFLGYGAHLLWAGVPRGENRPFYDILLEPGDKTVRRGGNVAVTARLVGFQAPSVRIFAKYRDSSKWEEAAMLPKENEPAYEFLFAGVPQAMEYYASAGKVRSKTYTLSVIDLPAVKRLRVTYFYPAWTGMGKSVEDPGGDLRAVEGTEAEIAVETDKPLANGRLVLEGGEPLNLSAAEGNWRSARVKIQKDGAYHIAALEQGEMVRLTDDYFIEARKDGEPSVRILRPGRDARVSPIEEVTVAVEASDDFGLSEVSLHYSVNAGPEKSVPVLGQKGARDAAGSTVLALEDYKLVPGDVVSVYASARDARTPVKTDMFFIEAQPFEREYSQSQQMGGGGGEGGEGGDQQGQISRRQKEIIAATWNQLRGVSGDRQSAAENARFLADMQAKLRDQARSLATRMGRRELSGQNQEFNSFSRDMQQAGEAMGAAVDKLKSMKWQEALSPEQKALQHLLRAEATFRQIQVAFGSRGQRGGGGGGGGMGRDLENLFDLELDTEKNQYETGQQQASSGQRSREVDEALQKLEQLARRQQELAERARQPQQSFQQRWQQEMLRREAEELQRRMEQLTRGGASGRQGQADSRLEQALRRLSEATEDMRRSNSSQSQAGGSSQGQAQSRRAAERLREAQDLMRGMRRQQADQQLDDLARRADRLATEQQEFQDRLRQIFSPQPQGQERSSSQSSQGSGEGKRGETPTKQRAEASPIQSATREQIEQSRQLAGQRERMTEDLARIERDMQQAARELAGSQPSASSRIRNALGELQQNEIATRMKLNTDALRRGYGPYVWLREAPVTQGLNALRDQLRDAQAALGRNPAERGQSEKALAQLDQLRGRLQQLARRGEQQGGGRQPGNRQAGGERQGGQGQEGQAQGSRQQGGGLRAGGRQQGAPGDQLRGQGEAGPWDRSAMNRGDWQPAPGGLEPRPATAAEAESVYRQSLRDLSWLRQSVEGNPEAVRDIQDLLREMERLDPKRFPGNPELVERLRTQVLPALEQVELHLRRQLEDQGTQARNAAGEKAPPGYAEAVAEYFRRLSKGK